MNQLSQSLVFTVPLGLEFHRQAEQFRRHQKSKQQAKQVYLNTLAVSAVSFYLECMGITTNRISSDSWNPIVQSLTNVADLEISNIGKLECRPVLPDAEIIDIPMEVWEDRIGFVAVRFDRALENAEILGFVEKVGTETLPINSLRSLDELLDYLQRKQPQQVVKLGQWFQDTFDTAWQAIESLFYQEKSDLAFRFRDVSNHSVSRAKLIDLEMQLKGQKVALLVSQIPKEDEKVEIRVQLHPVGTTRYLLPNFKLTHLSETGKVSQDPVLSRQHDSYIQLKRFTIRKGTKFRIQVAFADSSLMEEFFIV